MKKYELLRTFYFCLIITVIVAAGFHLQCACALGGSFVQLIYFLDVHRLFNPFPHGLLFTPRCKIRKVPEVFDILPLVSPRGAYRFRVGNRDPNSDARVQVLMERPGSAIWR